MNTMERIKTEWLKIFAETSQLEGFKKLSSGQLTVNHYKAILRQIFHNTRENPQLQALATVYLRGHERSQIKAFYRHAISEIGHDQLALNDLAALGEDVSEIPFERPLPTTRALTSSAFYQIQHQNPLGYLGYLFHLEFMPTHSGDKYMQLLSHMGVPREAMSFVEEHATVDIGHNKLMEVYIDQLVSSEDDIAEVVYAMRVTATLYANMIAEAVRSVDEGWDMKVFAGATHEKRKSQPRVSNYAVRVEQEMSH